MNDDFPWFLVAMVVIAFLRWISLRLQGKSGEPDFGDFEEDNVFAEMEPDPEPQARRANREGSPREEFRKFIEVLSGGAPPGVEPVSEPASQPSPPPIPYPEASRSRKRPNSVSEHDAAYQIRQKRPTAARGRVESAGESQVRSLLASSGGLKSALILREILDEPKGLKGFEDSPNF